MNDIENNKVTTENKELHNKENKFLKALKDNEIAFLKYKEATGQ